MLAVPVAGLGAVVLAAPALVPAAAAPAPALVAAAPPVEDGGVVVLVCVGFGASEEVLVAEVLDVGDADVAGVSVLAGVDAVVDDAVVEEEVAEVSSSFLAPVVLDNIKTIKSLGLILFEAIVVSSFRILPL